MALVKTDIVHILRKSNPSLSHTEAALAMDIFIGAIRDTLLHGGKVELRGFAVLEPRAKKAGFGRNIRTGETVPIPDGISVRFKPSKQLIPKATDTKDAVED